MLPFANVRRTPPGRSYLAREADRSRLGGSVVGLVHRISLSYTYDSGHWLHFRGKR